MNFLINTIIIVAAVAAVVFILFFYIVRGSKTIKVKLNNEQSVKKFIEFLLSNDKKDVFINIALTHDLLEEFKSNLTLTFTKSHYAGSNVDNFFIIFFLNEKQSRILFEPNQVIGYFTVSLAPVSRPTWCNIELTAH
jgi:hypothetical protein